MQKKTASLRCVKIQKKKAFAPPAVQMLHFFASAAHITPSSLHRNSNKQVCCAGPLQFMPPAPMAHGPRPTAGLEREDLRPKGRAPQMAPLYNIAPPVSRGSKNSPRPPLTKLFPHFPGDLLAGQGGWARGEGSAINAERVCRLVLPGERVFAGGGGVLPPDYPLKHQSVAQGGGGGLGDCGGGGGETVLTHCNTMST